MSTGMYTVNIRHTRSLRRESNRPRIVFKLLFISCTYCMLFPNKRFTKLKNYKEYESNRLLNSPEIRVFGMIDRNVFIKIKTNLKKFIILGTGLTSPFSKISLSLDEC